MNTWPPDEVLVADGHRWEADVVLAYDFYVDVLVVREILVDPVEQDIDEKRRHSGDHHEPEHSENGNSVIYGHFKQDI